jgi:hypothetical protein
MIKITETLTAFSHYTWHVSGGHMLVCDLQGEVDVKLGRVVLTDPAIHCVSVEDGPRAREVGITNLGAGGIQAFFSTHVCSDVCRNLCLDGSQPTISFT